MKKVISVVAALALAGAMATSALAADTGYTKDQLKSRLAIQAQNYGATQYEAQANQIIDALTDDQAKALDLDTLKGIVDSTKSAVTGETSDSKVIKAVNDGAAALENALKATGADVTISVTPKFGPNLNLIVDANVAVNGVSVPVQATTETKVEWTDSSKKDTATSGTTTSTTGVIKATGLNTTGAAAAGLAVASVLGVAAVKARKLGE